MPKVISFDGKTIVEPGVYSQIKGGETNPPNQATFGNVLLIDTGTNAGFGFNSGINGVNDQNGNSIYEFSSLEDFRTAVGGGLFWDVAKWLFKPSKDQGFRGVQKLFYVRAATTTKGTASYTWVGGAANGGTFSVSPRVEGIAANGVTNGISGLIERGFGMRMVSGTTDTAKFVIEFYRGSFRGNDYNAVPFDNIKAEKTVPVLLLRSIEFSTVGELLTWARNDYSFNTWFTLNLSSAVAGSGIVDSADLTASAGNKLVTAGTETYDAAGITNVLERIKELDYTFILSDKYEANMNDAYNYQLLSHIKLESEFRRIIVIGGGADGTKLADTTTAAAGFNSELVHICFSRQKRNDRNSVSGIRKYPTIYYAAAYLGLIAGQEPQLPATYKKLDFDGVEYELSKNQRDAALLSGIVHQRFVSGLGWVVNQDVNTLQKNDQGVFEDGTSPDGSTMRIALLLNKEIVENMRIRFIGSNVNLADPADIKAFTETYLKFRVASKINDNLILSFGGITVDVKGSDVYVTYGFVPNGPVNRIFVTGFMFNVNLSA